MITTLLQAANTNVTGEYSCAIDPSFLLRRVNNGNYTTPSFEVEVQNGVGEYEYLWSFEGGSGSTVNINNETSFRTSLNVSSYNSSIELTLKCTVKDKGNSDQETSATANIILNFGDAL